VFRRQARFASSLLLLGLGLLATYYVSSDGSAGLSSSSVERQLAAEASHFSILEHDGATINFEMLGGSCRHQMGPFDGQPDAAPPTVGELNFWKRDMKHILCFLPSDSEDIHAVQFSASSSREDSGGEFGFGHKVSIALRPNIASDALWPLQSGLPTVGLKLNRGVAFRTLALRTEVNGHRQETPVVVARPMVSEPIAVQFLDPSLGKCEASSEWGHARFVCRTFDGGSSSAPAVADAYAFDETSESQEEDQTPPADFIALCQACTGSSAAMGLLRIPDGDNLGSSAIASPWFGWSTDLPRSSSSRQWLITVDPPIDVSSDKRKLIDGINTMPTPGKRSIFRIALVNGDDRVTWLPTPGEYSQIESVGWYLCSFLGLSCWACLAMFIVSAMGLPAPTLAMLPAATSAVSALQFVVLLGNDENAPFPLKAFCKQLSVVAPEAPAKSMLTMGLFMLMVALVHAGAVCKHIMKNGTGSADALPHGLYFGAWELRALSLVALPLAFTCWTADIEVYMAVRNQGWLDVYDKFVPSVFATAVLVFMTFFSLRTSKSISSMFAKEQVIGTKLPGSDNIIYVDRICNQVRAMPIKPGQSKLLGKWPASASWCVAEPVATIRELEHTSPPRGEEPVGKWHAVWPAGPWGTPVMCGAKGDQDDPMSPTNSSIAPGIHRSISDNAYEMLVGTDNQSPLLKANSVKVRMQFLYAPKVQQSIAGVTCNSWVEAGVPVQCLRSLDKMIGKVSVRGNVGQLCGPLTSGRLAACFDWGTAWPLRWCFDMALKILLGLYVASLPYRDSESESILHGCVAATMIALSILVFIESPYVHSVDNICLFMSLLASSLAVILFQYGDHRPDLASKGVLVIAALLGIPLAVALTATVIAILFALRWPRRELHDDILPRVVRGWGYCSPAPRQDLYGRSAVNPGTNSWLWEDDCEETLCVADSASSSSVNVGVTKLGSAVPAVYLPAELRPQVVLTRVSSELSASGSIVYLPDADSRMQLPIPASLLFASAHAMGDGPREGSNGRQVSQTVPLLALLTPDGSRLIYQDPALNGGTDWQQAVSRAFGSSFDEAKLAKEIIKIAEETTAAGTSKAPGNPDARSIDSERPMAVIQVVPQRRGC